METIFLLDIIITCMRFIQSVNTYGRFLAAATLALWYHMAAARPAAVIAHNYDENFNQLSTNRSAPLKVCRLLPPKLILKINLRN